MTARYPVVMAMIIAIVSAGLPSTVLGAGCGCEHIETSAAAVESEASASDSCGCCVSMDRGESEPSDNDQGPSHCGCDHCTCFAGKAPVYDAGSFFAGLKATAFGTLKRATSERAESRLCFAISHPPKR